MQEESARVIEYLRKELQEGGAQKAATDSDDFVKIGTIEENQDMEIEQRKNGCES